MKFSRGLQKIAKHHDNTPIKAPSKISEGNNSPATGKDSSNRTESCMKWLFNKNPDHPSEVTALC